MSEAAQENTVHIESLIDHERLLRLRDCVTAVEKLPGDIAEVGVYRGGSAAVICLHTAKHVLLFDTFSGMPEVRPEHDDHRKGDFADTSLSQVAAQLSPCVNYELHRGVFPQEGSEYAEFRTFSLVHIDCDIYQSTKDCLEFFWPRLTPGGILVLDDYVMSDCRGVKVAVDEFFAEKQEKIGDHLNGQVIVRKSYEATAKGGVT